MALTFTSGATWAAGKVRYLGSTVSPERALAGSEITLRHYFVAETQLPKGFDFFVHVLDATTGQQLGQVDHPFSGGPLESWPVGKVVVDEHRLVVPNAPGPIRLALGFWNSQGRLRTDPGPLTDAEQRALGPFIAGEEKAAMKLPRYTIRSTKKPPVIDGKLDDASWRDAVAVDLVSSFDGRPVARRTTLRMLWDNEFIYAAFDAEDPDVWGTFRNHDDPIYEEEVVELFFDADGDGATYNELQVSPHNVTFDAEFQVRRGDLTQAKKWESQMTSAVTVDGTLDENSDRDRGWKVEMRIPIARLTHVPRIPPKPGDLWRFNAYRLEHLVRRKQGEGQAFSPLYVGDFHHLPRFGELLFE